MAKGHPSARDLVAENDLESLLINHTLFADFLEQYAPGPATRKDRTALYRLRSAMSHGGKLLPGELTGYGLSEFMPSSWEHRSMLDQGRSVARIAGINWLRQEGWSKKLAEMH